MGQNAEVMPGPLNSSIVIYFLEVRTIFSLFVLKKHMLGFAQIISVFRTGWRFARVGVGYPVSGTCSRSSDWCMFVLVYLQVWQFLARELRLKAVPRF